MDDTIHKLLLNAQNSLDNCHPSLALKFITKALSISPNNPEILSFYGFTALEILRTCVHDPENLDLDSITSDAISYLISASTLDPNNYENYLLLAQLHTSYDSIKYYTLASEIIKPLLFSESPNGINLKFKYSSILCSIAEIYLTDCCLDPLAESNCTELINQAISVDPNNPEIYSTLASIKLSQSNTQEATDAILKNISLWSQAKPGDEIWPCFSNRTCIAKLLIEVSLYDKATEILQLNLSEDDQDPETWYLFGWCYYIMSGISSDISVECSDASFTEDAIECFEMVLHLNEKLLNVEEEMLEHSSKLLHELKTINQENQNNQNQEQQL